MKPRATSDLRSKFGPARDQGLRPACLAFAASDFHAALREGWSPLSCEFAFFHAHRRAGTPPDKGTALRFMLDALREDGQPVEADWPYLAATPNDVDLWEPPRDISRLFRRDGERQDDNFDSVVELLKNGSPALLLLNLSDAFYAPNADGVVVASAGEQPDPQRRHAVVAVALATIENQPAILIRNSWGDGWGMGGYAWLPKKYLAPRLTRIAILKEKIDVPRSKAAA